MASKSTVAVRFTGDVADLKRATGEAERELEGFGSRVGPKLKTAMAGAGALAAGALAAGFMESLDQETSTARLGASLGLSDEEAHRLGKVAGDIYTQGWGESFDAVTGAVESVQSNLDEFIDPAQLQPLTVKALALADVFQLDIGEAVRTVGFMLRNGLAADAEEAFDLITVGLQNLPVEMRGEALEAINEYGGAFDALGLDGRDAINLILTAAQDTSVGVDKVGDAIKEFLIRSTDGSAATTEALETLGLDAERIATAIATGGESAEWAFDRIVEGLLGIEDPALRAQTSVALFGTPIEDLNVNKIPAFLEALQGTEDKLGDVEGAADDVGESMDTNAAKVEAFKRKLQQALVDFIADDVIPALEDLDENFDLTMQLIGSYVVGAADEKVVPALRRMRDGFQGPIDGALDLLELLGQLAGGDVVNAAADALGVDKSDLVLLPPEEFDRRQNQNVAPPSNIGSDFVPGSRIPLRARGGPVGFGDPYVVGEEGPELFVPSASGEIVPNGALGAGGIVNHFHINGGQHDERSLASTLAWMLAGR